MIHCAISKLKLLQSSFIPVLIREAKTLSHVGPDGKARMVDVGNKRPTSRRAEAKASISMSPVAYSLLRSNKMTKGDVLTVSQVAGILGTKRTSDLIPLCHPLSLNHIQVDLSLNDEETSVDIFCSASCEGTTGVEMEALMGASIAALTVYDMCKSVDQQMVIKDVRLLAKSGGKSDFPSENQ